MRDAQGNTLAVYDNENSTVNWREQTLYGSSRLGTWLPNTRVGQDSSIKQWDTVGYKQYELNSHIGNVIVTVTDKRLQHTTNNTTVDYYLADVANAQEYYSFGAMMPSRTYVFNASKNYRYGFNGQEKSDEIAGTGNHNTAEFWEYDTSAGRRWNLDPVVKPGESGYSTFNSNPVHFSDPDGDDAEITVKKDKNGKVTEINESATVYINGKGASEKKASQLNKLSKELYKTRTVNGVKISFDVKYIYDPSKKESDLSVFNLNNLLTFDSKPDNVYDKHHIREASHVNGSYSIGINGTRYTGNTGEIRENGNDNETILHETLHLLGFLDRYNLKTGKPLRGYETDIMAVSHSTTFNVSHYEHLLEFVQTHKDRISNQGILPVIEAVDVTYDKKGRSHLKQ